MRCTAPIPPLHFQQLRTAPRKIAKQCESCEDAQTACNQQLTKLAQLPTPQNGTSSSVIPWSKLSSTGFGFCALLGIDTG